MRKYKVEQTAVNNEPARQEKSKRELLLMCLARNMGKIISKIETVAEQKKYVTGQ